MSFPIAASTALGEASQVMADHHVQSGNLLGVLETGLSLQATGQHPGLKRDPINAKNLDDSLSDADPIMRGIQQLVAETLGDTGKDLAGLHTDFVLKLAQPGAAPDLLMPAVPGQPKKKPARDTVAQTILSWASSNALKQMATGGNLDRSNETDMKASKLFFRQAGSLILDLANVLVHSAILHVIRALKLFVKVADFDLVADTATWHLNHWFSTCKRLVLYIRDAGTLSIGGKAKLLLKQEAEIVALQRIVAQLSQEVVVLSTAVTKLQVPMGLAIETTGITFEIGPAGINVGLNLPPKVPLVVPPVPAPLPDVVPDVTVGEALRSPKTTSVNLGRVSGPADLPRANGMGVLTK